MKFVSLLNLFKMMGMDVLSPFTKVNAQYTHSDFYTEALHVMANMVRHKVLAEFHVDISKPVDLEANVPLQPFLHPPLTLIGDECLDVCSHEQLALVLRGLVDGKVTERFVQLRRLKDKTADTIVGECWNALQELRVPASRIQGVGSDGASNWSGSKSGVVVQIQSEIPTCIGVHCLCHRESLTSEDAADEVREVGQYFLDSVTSISLLFDQSGPRTTKLETVQEDMHKLFGDKLRKIRKRAATRWLSTDQVTESIWDVLHSLIAYLIDDSRNPNAADKGKVAGLRKSVGSYKFIFVLAVMRDVLPLLARLSRELQERALCHFSASEKIKVLRAELLKLKDRGGEHLREKLPEKIKEVELKVSREVSVIRSFVAV